MPCLFQDLLLPFCVCSSNRLGKGRSTALPSVEWFRPTIFTIHHIPPFLIPVQVQHANFTPNDSPSAAFPDLQASANITDIISSVSYTTTWTCLLWQKGALNSASWAGHELPELAGHTPAQARSTSPVKRLETEGSYPAGCCDY